MLNEQMNEQEFQRWYFDLIASLWRERADRAFVPRDELRDEFMDAARGGYEDSGDAIECLAVGGAELTLDCFAMSGPDFAEFARVYEQGDDAGMEDLPWRYRVERGGTVGYVAKENLTERELYVIAEALEELGAAAEAEADAMQEHVRRQSGGRVLSIRRKGH